MAFRERWLGRYLTHFPQYAFLALSPNRRRARLCGRQRRGPERSSRSSATSPISLLPGADATNIRLSSTSTSPSDWRGQGLGERLIETFCDAAREAGAPGVHVVTARGVRNVRFYEAIGFAEAGQTSIDGRELAVSCPQALKRLREPLRIRHTSVLDWTTIHAPDPLCAPFRRT